MKSSGSCYPTTCAQSVARLVGARNAWRQNKSASLSQLAAHIP